MKASETEKYLDDENQIASDRRPQKLRKRKYPRDRTFAVREKKAADKKIAKKTRLKKSEKLMAKFLLRFPDIDTPEGQEQLRIYLAWLKESHQQDRPLLNRKDVKFQYSVASVKAGGQKRQKSRTRVRAKHLPTLIDSVNEDERSRVQNENKAFKALLYPLSTHFNLWKKLVDHPSSFDQIKKKVIQIPKASNNKLKGSL